MTQTTAKEEEEEEEEEVILLAVVGKKQIGDEMTMEVRGGHAAAGEVGVEEEEETATIPRRTSENRRDPGEQRANMIQHVTPRHSVFPSVDPSVDSMI